MRGLVLSLAFPALVLAACGDDPQRPPPANDSPNSPPVLGGGGGGRDSGASASDAGTDGLAACTDLENTGLVVDQNGVVGDVPAGSGGTIQDGTYDLTESRVFVGAAGNPGPTGVSYKGSLRITGQVFERVLVVTSNGQTRQLVTSGGYSAVGGNVTFSETCPSARDEASTFSVLASTVVLNNVLTRESFTYTRR